MIAKHVPMSSAKKSDFAVLVNYLVGPQGKDERVGLVRVTNCHSEQAEFAITEVLNSQVQNSRTAADKTYHLIVSFRAGEAPDDATLQAIEERLCAGLGLADHQRISVVHHDTDNLHLHIAISKIHPTRYTIHEPFNAYHTLGQLCEKLESEYGLERDNHKADKVGSENRAFDMERHAAVESLLGWIKRECKDHIHDARSWEGLHQVMREHGLRIHERANGLVITSENGTSVKASSVDRAFSKTKLEARLGSFVPPPKHVQNMNASKRYKKQPLRSRVDTVELHARYKAAQRIVTTTRADEWNKAIARRTRLIEDAKRVGRLKRAAIKLVNAPPIGKRLMYAATSKTLRKDIAAINLQYRKERQEIYEKYQRLAWADWLRCEATNGNQEALAALRAREASAGLKGNTLGKHGSTKGTLFKTRHDSITKKGTIIYRVGASAVRDDGDKLNISRGFDQAGLEAALWMAVERYGSSISVNGTAAFKENIVRTAAALNLPASFDDDALESRRQQLVGAKQTKEKNYGDNSSEDGSAIGRRVDRSGDRVAKQATASDTTAGTARAGAVPTKEQRAAHRNKPDSRHAQHRPPPKARHCVRGLSELGVVHVTSGSEVLLPGHVPDHLEYQGTKPDNSVRRDLHRPARLKPNGGATKPAGAPPSKPKVRRVGTAPPPASKDRLRELSQLDEIVIEKASSQPLPSPAMPAAAPASRDNVPMKESSTAQAAAEKYIAEREQKRAKGLDIPRHVPRLLCTTGAAEYAGVRHIDGQALALLKLDEEIVVLPIDGATAKRLTRFAIGQQLVLTAKGAIKTKGRSR